MWTIAEEQMLDIRFDDATLFVQLIRLLKDIVVDGVLRCHTNGMTLQAMDASHVVLCTFTLSTNAFASYACEQPLRLGVHLSSLDSILRCAKKDDTMLFKSGSDSDTLHISFQNKNNHRSVCFELKLMHLNIDELDIPDTPYGTTVEMPSQQLLDTLKDLQIVGDVCTMLSCSNWIQFSTTGPIGNAKINMHRNEDAETQALRVHIEAQRQLTQAFSMKCFLLIAKAATLSETVCMFADETTPLKLKYKLANAGELCFHLATRAEV